MGLCLFSLVLGCAATAEPPGLSYDDGALESAVKPDAALDADGSSGSDASLPVPAGDDILVATDITWRNRVRRLVDEAALTNYFAEHGGVPPYAVDIYAVAIKERPGGLAYRYFDVNKGAFSQAFWPASTIKFIAALTALTQIRSWGFTGEATVTWSGFSDSVNDIVERAVRVSSNEDYDRTLQIAGNDYVNGEWLTEDNGFPTTVLKGSYAKLGVVDVPAFTLTEGDMKKDVPARSGQGNYACESGRSNCTTLYELSEAIRRATLHDELPEDERFDIHEGDRANLLEAACNATPSHFIGPAKEVFGDGVTVCHKAGWVPNLDRLDHGLITAPSGLRFLLGVAVPDSSSSADEVSAIAEVVSRFFESGAQEGDFWLQRSFGEQGKLIVDGPRWLAYGGASVRLFKDGQLHAEGQSPLVIDDHDLADSWLTLEVYDAEGELIGIRHATLAPAQP